jgi:hypothetical protein
MYAKLGGITNRSAGRTRELWEPRWLSSSSSRYSPCLWLHAVVSALLNATTTTAGDTAADIITSTIGTTAIETGKRRPSLRAWRGANPQRLLAMPERVAKRPLTVHCLGPECHHQAVKTLEELKLWNDMIFVDVPQHRHFVCTLCGRQDVKVMPIFPPARGTRR